MTTHFLGSAVLEVTKKLMDSFTFGRQLPVCRPLSGWLTGLAVMLIGFVCALSMMGCGRTETARPGIIRDLTVECEDGVRFFDVMVKYHGNTCPFGVVTHFGASWAPVPYHLREDRVVEITSQETSSSEMKTAVVTLAEPKDAELDKFTGVILSYTKAGGWTGKLVLEDTD